MERLLSQNDSVYPREKTIPRNTHMRFMSQPLDDNMIRQQHNWNRRTKNMYVPSPTAILTNSSMYCQLGRVECSTMWLRLSRGPLKAENPRWGISITLKLISTSSERQELKLRKIVGHVSSDIPYWLGALDG